MKNCDKIKKRCPLVMQKYEILEYTTDLKVRASGETKEELFLNMMIGMFRGARVETKDQDKVAREIKVESIDEPSLLVDFLSEVLSLSDINNEAYFKVEFSKLTNKELQGKIFGQPIEKIGLEIKAVTYHGIEIKKVGDTWEAIILFDI